jgi:hypothetical protein
MYNVENDDDFVNEDFDSGGGWCQTDCILKECGDHWTLTQAHEKNFYYGGKRRRKKYQDGKVVDLTLGRASEASEEQKRKNAIRIQKRRDNSIRDRGDCNEAECDKFETLTGHGHYQDIKQAHYDRRQYFDRLERFVRTSRLFRKPVTHFTPVSDFALKAFGVLEFQDGKRNKDGKGTGNIHFHHFHNTPRLPQVHVIHAKVRDSKTQEFCEVYLSHKKGFGFYWSKAADRQTPWFNTEREARDYLQRHKQDLPGLYFNVESRKIIVNALLWGKGRTHIKQLQDLRKQGKLSSAGEYLCQYTSKGGIDDRLRNHRGWYKRGDLERPTFYRDPDIIRQAIQVLDLWNCLVKEIHFVAEYMGAMTKYYFNLWVEEFPWIKRMYELKEQGLRMTRADWIACGVVEDYQPLLL